MIRQRKVRAGVFWGIVSAAALLAFGLFALTARENRLGKQMFGLCAELNGAVSKYETEHNGAPPRTIQDLVTCGCLKELPANPYTGERLFVLSSSDRPKNGGIRYLVVEDEITHTIIETSMTVYGRFGLPVYGPRTRRYIK